MTLNPYLLFNGDCQEAFQLYRDLLDGRIDFMQTFDGSPACDDVPFEWYDKILHVRLVAGNNVLMGSDAPPGRYSRPAGMSVALMLDTATDAERVFDALSEEGNVQMPMEETFWAERFGMLTDRFGIPWMVNGAMKQLATD